MGADLFSLKRSQHFLPELNIKFDRMFFTKTSIKCETIVTAARSADVPLAEIDETNLILKDRADKFVVAYESTRRVVKPPHTATQLKICVTDKATFRFFYV